MPINSNVLSNIWNKRPDLQQVFPLGVSDPRFFQWARTSGITEYPYEIGPEILPETPEERADRFAREKEKVRAEGEYGDLKARLDAMERKAGLTLSEGEGEIESLRRESGAAREDFLRRSEKENKQREVNINEGTNARGLYDSGIRQRDQGERTQKYLEGLGEYERGYGRTVSDYDRRLAALRKRYQEDLRGIEEERTGKKIRLLGGGF